MENALKETTKQFDYVDEHGLKVGVVPILGTLSAVVHRADGRPDEDLGVICRQKVSTAFVDLLVKALDGGDHATEYGYFKTYKYHEWGTDATAEANTQNKCIAQLSTVNIAGTSELDAGTQVGTGTTYTTVATLVATGGGGTVTEHCVHPTVDFSPADSLGMDRSKFTGVAVGTGDSITFTYVLSVPAET